MRRARAHTHLSARSSFARWASESWCGRSPFFPPAAMPNLRVNSVSSPTETVRNTPRNTRSSVSVVNVDVPPSPSAAPCADVHDALKLWVASYSATHRTISTTRLMARARAHFCCMGVALFFFAGPVDP